MDGSLTRGQPNKSSAHYLPAFQDMLWHWHFDLQVAVVLGPGVILSHSSIVTVRICLELLLFPEVGGGVGEKITRCWVSENSNG